MFNTPYVTLVVDMWLMLKFNYVKYSKVNIVRAFF